jgi:hypothetical protein
MVTTQHRLASCDVIKQPTLTNRIQAFVRFAERVDWTVVAVNFDRATVLKLFRICSQYTSQTPSTLVGVLAPS